MTTTPGILRGQGWSYSATPQAPHPRLGDKTVFCCSHVELEYFEAYFLYKQWGL